MDTYGNAILGLVFLLLSAGGTFLMFYLWGYPFDHEKMVSAAPKPLMRLHRAIGWAYLTIYVVLMFQMVPRLWSYEVEFPARTVAHFLLGMAIGVILLVKISIVRWFKHLESTMVPFLGTSLLLCTFLLVGLSLPFAFRERALRARAAGGSVFSAESLARVKSLLPEAGLPKNVSADRFASAAGLKRGREVLLDTCVTCHDVHNKENPEQYLLINSQKESRICLTCHTLGTQGESKGPRLEWIGARRSTALSRTVEVAWLIWKYLTSAATFSNDC